MSDVVFVMLGIALLLIAIPLSGLLIALTINVIRGKPLP